MYVRTINYKIMSCPKTSLYKIILTIMSWTDSQKSNINGLNYNLVFLHKYKSKV